MKAGKSVLHYLIKEKFGHFFMGKEPTQAAQGNMYPTIQALITENRATYNLLRAMIIPSWEGKLASQVQHLYPSSTKDTAANRFVIRERLCFKNNPKKTPQKGQIRTLLAHARARARSRTVFSRGRCSSVAPRHCPPREAAHPNPSPYFTLHLAATSSTETRAESCHLDQI